MSNRFLFFQLSLQNIFCFPAFNYISFMGFLPFCISAFQLSFISDAQRATGSRLETDESGKLVKNQMENVGN